MPTETEGVPAKNRRWSELIRALTRLRARVGEEPQAVSYVGADPTRLRNTAYVYAARMGMRITIRTITRRKVLIMRLD